jgi:hypothetical protein
MTKKKLTTLACAALLTATFAGSAMAQSVSSTTSVGVTASAGTGDILSTILGDLTGLLGGLGLGSLGL